MIFGTNCYQCNFIIFICNLALLSLLLFFFLQFVSCFCNTVKFIVMQIKLLLVVVDKYGQDPMGSSVIWRQFSLGEDSQINLFIKVLFKKSKIHLICFVNSVK